MYDADAAGSSAAISGCVQEHFGSASLPKDLVLVDQYSFPSPFRMQHAPFSHTQTAQCSNSHARSRYAVVLLDQAHHGLLFLSSMPSAQVHARTVPKISTTIINIIIVCLASLVCTSHRLSVCLAHLNDVVAVFILTWSESQRFKSQVSHIKKGKRDVRRIDCLLRRRLRPARK